MKYPLPDRDGEHAVVRTRARVVDLVDEHVWVDDGWLFFRCPSLHPRKVAAYPVEEFEAVIARAKELGS